jgi:hypothetical protein
MKHAIGPQNKTQIERARIIKRTLGVSVAAR